jgi:hypothetical protein
MIRRCYAEQNRPTGTPLATWQDAFKPKQDVLWEEYINGQWKHWQLTLPGNGNLPGNGAQLKSDWEYFKHVIQLLVKYAEDVLASELSVFPKSISIPKWLSGLLENLEFWKKNKSTAGASAVELFLHDALAHALSLADQLEGQPSRHSLASHRGIIFFLEEFAKWLFGQIESLLDSNDTLRRLWIFVDLTVSILKGVLVDGVLTHGWNVINDYNWVDWLAKHGASPSTLNSAVVRGWHDYFFAYYEGDPNQPCIDSGKCKPAWATSFFRLYT